MNKQGRPLSLPPTTRGSCPLRAGWSRCAMGRSSITASSPMGSPISEEIVNEWNGGVSPHRQVLGRYDAGAALRGDGLCPATDADIDACRYADTTCGRGWGSEFQRNGNG